MATRKRKPRRTHNRSAGGAARHPRAASRRPAACLRSARASMPSTPAFTRCSTRRARFAQQVGISKSATGRAVDFYRPEREAQVLRMALKRNQGPLRDEEIARLFREIMSALPGSTGTAQGGLSGGRRVLSRRRRCSNISVHRCARCRCLPSMRYSRRLKAAWPTLAWCPSKIPAKAR